MGRFVTIDGARTGPAIHVADPGQPLEAYAIDPHDLWRTQPSVRKVVDYIARQLASTPLHVYRRSSDDARTRDRDSPAARLLERPSGDRITPYRFWHTIHTDGLIHDRWLFVVLEEDENGPQRLFRIPPHRWRALTDTEGLPEAFVVWTRDGEEYHVPPARCVYELGYSTVWGGPTPPSVTLADTLREVAETRKYRADLFRNGTRVPAVIERPAEAGDWDDAAFERFKSQFGRYRAGGGSEGGIPVLEDGMKLKPVDVFDPKALEVLEARKLTDAEVAAAYHIPPELVGAREGTFANLDALRQSLYSISLGPNYVAWEQTVTVMLLPILGQADGYYAEAHVDAKLRGSFIEQAQQTSSATGAPWLTRNEARRMRNLPPVDGGDQLVVPLNVLEGGLANPRDTGTPGNGTDAAPKV